MNAVHEPTVTHTRLKYKGDMQSWIFSDRQLPLKDREGNPWTRGYSSVQKQRKIVTKVTTKDNPG